MIADIVLSKLPTRQLTCHRLTLPPSVISKLPTRQLTHKSESLRSFGISKLPTRQLTDFLFYGRD